MADTTLTRHETTEEAKETLHSLKAFTAARIALGRAGTSVPLQEALSFKLAHATARDAVYAPLDNHTIFSGVQLLNLPVLGIKSKAGNREEYLRQPGLGRQLDDVSALYLTQLSLEACDVAMIIADGLSAPAANMHAIPLLGLLVAQFRAAGLSVGPVVVAENARVAIGDEIGKLLNAKLTVVLIGERPGLSSFNSLSAYLTYMPKPGLTDEMRNCVSNIRPEGLPYQVAFEKIFYLINEAFRKKLSGVNLKEEAGLINNK